MESHSKLRVPVVHIVEKKAHQLLKLNYRIIIESLHVSIHPENVVFNVYARLIDLVVVIVPILWQTMDLISFLYAVFDTVLLSDL